MSSLIFVDTCYWIARLSPHDQLAEKARAVTESLRGQRIMMVTTDEVLTETLNGFAERGENLRRAAANFVSVLQQNTMVRVVPQTRERWRQGQALYVSRPDKGYSLTDCISMVVCRAESITQVLTSDRHFVQEGFTALLV